MNNLPLQQTRHCGHFCPPHSHALPLSSVGSSWWSCHPQQLPESVPGKPPGRGGRKEEEKGGREKGEEKKGEGPEGGNDGGGGEEGRRRGKGRKGVRKAEGSSKALAEEFLQMVSILTHQVIKQDQLTSKGPIGPYFPLDFKSGEPRL